MSYCQNPHTSCCVMYYLCQFCQGLCIAPVTALQAVHGTLREGSRTGELAHMTLSCTPLRHQSWTSPLQLHRVGLCQGADRGVLEQILQMTDVTVIYTHVGVCVCVCGETNLWTQTCFSL